MRWFLVFVVLSGSCAHAGTRDVTRDFACDEEARPHAYAFEDQPRAEAAGCSAVRIHRSVPRGPGGAMIDDEDVVYCCP